MPYSLTVTNPQTKVEWNQELTEHDFEDAERLCAQSKRVVNFVEALIYPVRTQDISEFCDDLFLPTYTNQVKRVNDVALRIILSAIALIVDLFTSPIRFATLFPRITSTEPKGNHPLCRYLVQRGAGDDILKGNTVEVTLSKNIEEVRKDEFGRDVLHKEKSRNSRNVHFIDVPDYDGAIKFSDSFNASDSPLQARGH